MTSALVNGECTALSGSHSHGSKRLSHDSGQMARCSGPETEMKFGEVSFGQRVSGWKFQQRHMTEPPTQLYVSCKKETAHIALQNFDHFVSLLKIAIARASSRAYQLCKESE
jgi:hypothetical protein